ncbi:MAG TPA: ribonuclease Z [Longimicrobiales bacterium]|nr:ribonuclease Z [Longimicrobiales bacterium]
MIRVTFLGTAASRPTVGRNVSALMMQREGESLLFDCGEGTQRQMMRYGTGFSVDDIFFTHLHADHFLGVIGLLRTMGLQGREHAMRLWCPEGGAGILHDAVNLGMERLPFPVDIVELQPGERVEREGHDIVVFRTAHGPRSLGYALVEHPRLGRFDPERARALGVPEGPLFGRLHRGEDVEVDGRVIRAAELVGPPRPGRRVVYSGDTRPCHETREMARTADLLVHDATFSHDERERARHTNHATAREAAELARSAGAQRLVLTHISARYADDARALEREARAAFRETTVAWDGLVVEIPFRDGDTA